MGRADRLLPLETKRHIDQICLAFEAAWQGPLAPQIETYLNQIEEPERSTLLRELLVLDLDYRLRSGQTPTPDDYLRQLPHDSQIVAEAFRTGALGAIPSAGTRIRYFGDYELLEEIGRGGMGVVYKARQLSLDRIVAVKMILAGHFASAAEVERFRREAVAAAGLQHPGIVPIHEIGEQQGLHYFAMDYIAGQSLSELPRQTIPSTLQSAAYVRDIAAAVDYAHRHGVLHHDLKPSNVLVDRLGQPRITDFGLAKLGETGSELTASGQTLGTPSYMPPEQATGSAGQISPASDVYSLGTILYELLTGRPPFRAASAADTIVEVLQATPLPPRLLNPRIPRDLQTICLKCLEKEPSRRYATAQALADDLDRFLEGRQIQARPAGAVQRAWRWCRRNRAVTLLSAAVLVILLAAVGVSSYFAVQSAGYARSTPEQLWHSYLAQARAGRRSGEPGQRYESLEALGRAAAIRPTAELRDEAIACMALVDVRPTGEWPIGPGGALQADGNFARFACEDRGGISIRRVGDGSELMHLERPDGRAAESYRFSPDGRFLASAHVATAAQPAECRVWDLTQRRMTAQLPAIACHAFDFAPDSPLIVTIEPEGTVCLVEPASGKTVDRFPLKLPRQQLPTVLRFHPLRKQVAAVQYEGVWLHIVDLDARRTIRSINVPQGLLAHAWHPHGELLATGCADWNIRLISADNGHVESTIRGHRAEVRGVSFNPGGEFLASRSWDGTVRLWETQSGRELLRLEYDCLTMDFSLDGHKLGYRTRYGRWGCFEVAGGRAYRALRPSDQEEKGPWGMAFRPDGRWLAVASYDGIRLWDAHSLHQAATLPLGETQNVAFSAGSLITNSAAGLQRWPIVEPSGTHRLQLGPPETLLPAGGAGVGGVDATPDGQHLAAVLGGGRAARVALQRPDDPVLLEDLVAASVIAISPDARWLAVGTWSESGVKVWDCARDRVAVDLEVSRGRTRVAFSSDSRWLLTSTDEGYRLWRVGNWSLGPPIARARKDHYGPAAFSPDGRLLAVAHSRTVVGLIDPETGSILARLQSPDPRAVNSLCFSPDSTHLAVAGDNTVRLWDLREIRRGLAELGLDWNLPPYSSSLALSSSTGQTRAPP